MKPFYQTSEFWGNLLLTVLGAIASMQEVPGSVTQAAGFLAMILGPVLHTVSRTTLKYQDSAEAHEMQKIASIAVPLPVAKP